MSWQTRLLAGYVAATAQVEGDNPLIATAATVAYDHDEVDELADPGEQVVPTPPPVSRPGSFEKLQRGFGA